MKKIIIIIIFCPKFQLGIEIIMVMPFVPAFRSLYSLKNNLRISMQNHLYCGQDLGLEFSIRVD